jgi:PKHD-type hydroxylase
MDFFRKPQNLFEPFQFHKKLEDNIISDILELSSTIEPIQAKTGKSSDMDLRTSQVKWIEYSPNNFSLFNLLSELITTANVNFFNFDISPPFENIQYTEYYSSNKGKYDWHQDMIEKNQKNISNPYSRKLSLTIQLSDPNEYEGGDLEVYYSHPEKGAVVKAPKEKGKIIVFPSYLWHRVTPVTHGIEKVEVKINT